MAYVETPRTDAGNATLMTNGHNLESFSIENSLLSPLKRKDTRDDLLSQMRNGRGSLKTPRARYPLSDRRNVPATPARQEFTPLLHSVTKKNFERRTKPGGQPETPGFLKDSLQHSDSPALPGTEVSALYESELGSSVVGNGNGTPMPQITSSSEQSTPLAILPKRDTNGMLNDQGNLMTLREQENIINKVEKENFGLKLKIHFLEESLRKTGPGFNEAALKENTDLKVDRVTLQKELSRCKKMLGQAERDVEALRRHIEEVQSKAKHKADDEKLQIELETLKQTLIERETQLEELRIETETAEGHADEVEKLKATIEDLEVDLREKDRQIDERDDEIDKIKEQERKDTADLDEAEAELDEARKRVEELELDGGKIAEAADKLEEAQAELREALESKERAEADLEGLREEMFDKSINTKGLSRQLEEKVNRLQDELTKSREKHAQYLATQADSEHESMAQKCQNLNDQLQRAIADLQSKSEEKDLLHSRHDALTSESQQLQKDLVKAHSLIEELERDLANEKEYAEDNDRQLRSEAQNEIKRLSKEIEDLQRDIEKRDTQSVSKEDLWKSEQRDLETQKEKAEEKALGLQRTVNKLQETEGTLSSRETQMQEALDGERQRHETEEAITQRRIQAMTGELHEKRQEIEDLRSNLSESNEDLQISQRDQADLEEKIQALEDEIEVLQTSLDEETEKRREEVGTLEQEIILLRSQLDAANAQLDLGQGNAASPNHNELEAKLHIAEGKLSALLFEKESMQDRLTMGDQEKQKLRAEIEIERDELRSGSGNAAEHSTLQERLSALRKQETDFLQRETAQKSLVRDLKQKVARLESQLHDAAMATGAVGSPKSSVNDSARKSELIEVHRQLTEAQQQLRESRTRSKDDLKAIQQRLLASERQNQDTLNVCEQLEADLARAQHEQTSLQAANTASSTTINRLRTRISSLENRAQLQGTFTDNTIAEERKDLHDLLKDSKLQAEELQLQVVSREATIAAAATREKNVRAQLKRVREERSLQTQQSSVLVTELDDLQTRYEHAIERFSRQQRSWEDERRSIASRVRFPNTSFSESYANEKELEKRHIGELKGLAKQIQWLRAKLRREGTFREGLVYEKKWLLLRIEMFEACNATDLQLLGEMGVNPPMNSAAATRLRLGNALKRDATGMVSRKKPSLRTVAFAVIAGSRMRRMADEWAVQRKAKEALGKKMLGLGKRKSR